jgi:hypothetical protein
MQSIKKYRGAETDDFSRLQFSFINYEYYKNLVKVIFENKEQEKEFLDNVKENKYIFLKSYFDGIVFGKWLSETEKIFYVNALWYLLQKNKYFEKLISLAYTKISNRKIKIYLSFGSAGKRGIRGYFSYSFEKNKDLIIHFNHLERQDKIFNKPERYGLSQSIKIKKRYLVSGIGSIYHEFGHYVDFAVMNYSLPYLKGVSYPNRDEYRNEIKRWAKSFYKSSNVGGLVNYFTLEQEVFARCFELYNNEIFENGFAFKKDYMPSLMFEQLYILPQKLGIYDFLKTNFFEKYK